MQANQIKRTRDGRPRVVFNDTVVSFRVAANVTLGDIARRLDGLSSRRCGNPVAINITLMSRGADPAFGL